MINGDCAVTVQWQGAWWYNTCHVSNLNGRYLSGANDNRGMRWSTYVCSLYHSQLHTWNCDDSEKVVTALPFANNRLLREFRSFSVKPIWRPIVKRRQNVRKPSFRKRTMEMPVKVTLWTALSNFVRVRCKFSQFGQFQRLVRTKIWPSSIIIKIDEGWGYYHCMHNLYNQRWRLLMIEQLQKYFRWCHFVA